MVVSIRDDVVLHGGFQNVVDGLRALGLEAVEMHVGRSFTVRSLSQPEQFHGLNSLEGVRRLTQELEQHCVRISAFLLGNDFGRPDREEQVAWMIRTVQLAHHLNVPAVRVDAIISGWEALGLEGAVQLFTDSIRQVLDATENTDVQLGIENHGSLGNRPEFLQAVLEAVGSSRLGLTLDSGNFYWFGHPLSTVYNIIRQFAPAVKHTHIKNIAYPHELREQQRPIGYEYGKFVCPIPDGDIDHRVVVSLLREAGYDGDLCIEDESLGKFAPTERAAVLQRDADHLRSLVTNL